MEDSQMELHPSEWRLIEAIRSIDSGEIESIKIQNGLPVIFKIALGKMKFAEEKARAARQRVSCNPPGGAK